MSRPLISAREAASQGRQWAELRVLGDWLCWLESRPAEGRTVLLGLDQAGQASGAVQPRCLTPPEYSLRSRVHEYGGGAFALTPRGAVFVNDADQNLYLQRLSPPFAVSALTADSPSKDGQRRFGDLYYDRFHDRLLAVEERHRPDEAPENRLVSIDLQGGTCQVLAAGADFYASPRVSPDGRRLAWLSWDHPQQPWRATRLEEARLNPRGEPQSSRLITNGQYRGADESVFQPEYGADNRLYFVSDRQGWWNLYRSQGDRTEPLLPMAAEFGVAQWQLGLSCYRVLDSGHILCSYIRAGRGYLAILHLFSGQLETLDLPYTRLHGLHAEGDRAFALAEGPCPETVLLRIAPATAQALVLSRLAPAAPQKSRGSLWEAPELVVIDRQEAPLYAWFYRPPPPSFSPERRPPLLIQLHGGPTAMAAALLDTQLQFWIERGFAVLVLNYRGSSGFGRAYRHALRERWGELERDDAIAAARYCVDRGWVDRTRIAIRGNSAGGYTVLRVLGHPASRGLFRAGASHYGISDLLRLNRETHKFESHYLSWLIGDPQTQKARYRARSPLSNPEALRLPVIFFQGALDPVVPPNQTRALHQALRKRGLESHYQLLPGEGHGFRRAESRARVLTAEYAFYRQRLDLSEPRPE